MTVQFADLLETPLRSGFTIPASTRGSGVRMLNMGELFKYPRIPDTEMVRVDAPPVSEERAYLREGDLVFARRSLTLEGAGKCAIVAQVRTPTTWESSIIRARIDPSRANALYLFYYFRSPQGRRQMETIVEQVAAAGIRLSELAKLAVPSPPLAEQQAIAEVLGTLDDKIAANLTLAASAEQLASTIYASETAFWNRVPSSRVLEPVLGGTPSRVRDDFWADGDVPWVTVRDVTAAPSHVVSETAENITATAVSQTKSKPLPTGSVILTARGTVGEVARLARPAAFNQSCYGFRAGLVPPSILFFSLLGAAERARAVSHGSVFDTITKATFDHIDIPWEPELVGNLEERLAPLLACVSAATQENRVLAETRDTLLPQLLSGRLRVRGTDATASAVAI